MNYAVEHQNTVYSFLVTTPRKKRIKHSLIYVDSGLVLVKLGKNEYAVEQDNAIWLPFDCLTSVTFVPGSRVTQINFSVRLQDKFPTQAGFVSLPPVSKAILEKLSSANVTEQDKSNLLAVVRDESRSLRPLLDMSPLSLQISQWSADEESELSKELLLVLSLREAKKKMLSGTKRELVIDEFFAGREEEFEQLAMLVMGESL
ncbi:AraC family transcriptional regulator [Vibrio nigripulchritudo]|uniref:AraC family transcriptional regulator n=1 Tax=Vibrio nigripulchritudo TaxID=28173 RepID=UPI00249155A8|nr:AraC family transcriptional regulator [Vibrio nigripulchritudo]BDU39877.1 AraC family transcriptional regulator [Vibrio nigripulchritudo]BDU45601.1 AraC family transcriptional regulator [Vibrio nigripulchritudo]